MRIRIEDRTFQDAQENLDYEETLLNHIKEDELILRFWSATYDFVVMGRSNKAPKEVHIERCQEDNIPILKRCSGGGTILQSLGVLNYAIIAPIKGDLKSIKNSNVIMMSGIVKELNLFQEGFKLQGDSDITYQGKKCCGNAQKRSLNHLLFHGCFLQKGVDLRKISKYLKHPSKEPLYRNKRMHDHFLCHCPLHQDLVKKAISKSMSNLKNHLNK